MRRASKWLLALVLTLLGAWAYEGLGGPLVEGLLRACAGPAGDGVELWRVEPIYRVLSQRLFLRAAALAWTVPAFLWIFSRMRRRPRGQGPAKLLFSGYLCVFLWCSMELLLAPFLIRPLDLYNFYFVLDVDHRPPPSHRGIGTNADGLRVPFERDEVSGASFNLLFAGDSYTFGFRVEADEAFPALVQGMLASRRPDLDPRAVNLGWTSSSPLLGLRLLEDVGDGYHPDLLIYCLDMTDFHDDIKYDNMLRRRGIYRWYDKIPITLRLFKRLWPSAFEALYRHSNDNLPEERFFHSEQPLAASRPFLEPALENLRRLEAWAGGRGIPFVVVVFPRSYQYSSRESPRNREAEFYTVLGSYSLEPFRFFEELGARERFPIVSLLGAFQETDVFPTCFEDDPHWNAAGHRVAADAIVTALAAGGFLPAAPEAP